MKKFVLIPDSFKGTLSSQQVCRAMEAAIHRHLPGAVVRSIPVADGGEGTCEAFLAALGGEKRTCWATGPLGEPMEAFYAALPGGQAVVEMAACAGLPLVGKNKDPEKTTTYGVGELLKAALDAGHRRIVLGLGGSATNDGGAGMACALGAVFYTAAGEAFVPTGGTLGEIARVDTAGLDPRLKEAEILAMCDVDNPLCGPQGASAVFGPQKGADVAMVQRLDAGLAHYARCLARDVGVDVLSLPGGGAAGGLGAGAVAFLGARLTSGISAVLDTVGFDEELRDADLVFTGEGKLDSQSLRGKVVCGVARRAQRAGVPVVAVVGDVGENVDAVYTQGVTAVFSTNRVAVPYSQARLRAGHDLVETMDNILRLLCLGSPKEDL